MISPRLLALVRCPDCGGALGGSPPALKCQRCGREYGGTPEYLDLRPRTRFAETTRYVEEVFHVGRTPARVAPPLLSAGIRHAMLRKFLRPGPTDTIVDLGCGSGRALVWIEDSGAHLVGVDVAPFFAEEVRARMDLVVGDLRCLPLADGTFTKAFALDVWEHLSLDALEQVLRETARVLVPGGALFVYSHVRKNSPLARVPRAMNRLAQVLERVGLVDLSYERLRKSDHVNPLADLDELRRVVGAAGFRLAAIRYYTPIVGTFVENVLLRVAERAFARAASRRGVQAREDRVGEARSAGATQGTAQKEDVDAVTLARDAVGRARAMASDWIAARGWLYYLLLGVTWLMKLDVVLLGRIRSGPFFALLVKDRGATDA